MPTVRPLSPLVFGIVGLGRIGTGTVLRAKAFGMRVLFYDPFKPTGTDRALGIERATSLSKLLVDSDVVSLHVPLTADTQGMISVQTFASMRRRFNRIEVGAIERQEREPRADDLDRISHAGRLWSGEIVHIDDVALRQDWNQDLLDVGQKPFAIMAPS